MDLLEVREPVAVCVWLSVPLLDCEREQEDQHLALHGSSMPPAVRCGEGPCGRLRALRPRPVAPTCETVRLGAACSSNHGIAGGDWITGTPDFNCPTGVPPAGLHGVAGIGEASLSAVFRCVVLADSRRNRSGRCHHHLWCRSWSKQQECQERNRRYCQS